VTLIYPDPVAAQALGKIPFVLGPKQGLDMLARVPGLDVIIILTSGEKIFSKGISHSLRAVDGGIK
jgi:thiamine biosynthesis lipoprotein ApbE